MDAIYSSIHHPSIHTSIHLSPLPLQSESLERLPVATFKGEYQQTIQRLWRDYNGVTMGECDNLIMNCTLILVGASSVSRGSLSASKVDVQIHWKHQSLWGPTESSGQNCLWLETGGPAAILGRMCRDGSSVWFVFGASVMPFGFHTVWSDDTLSAWPNVYDHVITPQSKMRGSKGFCVQHFLLYCQNERIIAFPL